MPSDDLGRQESAKVGIIQRPDVQRHHSARS